jgi:signal transduction histidine kinase/ActR/RegA family two-component response regulator
MRDAWDPPRVLVVDDDRELAETIADILKGEDIPVAIAQTGAEALAEVGRDPRGIALVDVRLPDIFGIELMKRLREAAPDLDVVIVTGNATVGSAVAALNLGAARYVVKPCDPDELRAVVRDVLDLQLLRHRNRLYLNRLEVQNGLSSALSMALRPEEVAVAAVEAVRGLTDVKTVVVLALTERSSSDPAPDPALLRPLAMEGCDEAAARELASMEDVRELLAGRSVPAPGMAVIPSGPAGAPGPLALCRLRGRASDLGVLAVSVGREFMGDEHHWDLLMAIGNWVGVALERAMLHRRLELAYQDVKNAQRRMVQAEKLSAVGRLAAGLAHEVGTPLNIISGRAEYLLRDADPESRQAQGLKVIVQQIERISRLIGQVLDFSREYGPVRDRIELAGVVAAVQSLLDTRIEKAGIDLDVFLPPRLPMVTANPNQMQQVFINLLMNSIDAIQADPGHDGAKGRGRISIAAEHLPRLRKVRVTVEDNGQGIAEENLDKVFDPFFSTKPVGSGTGLGLAVVYGIVTEHGGTIDIESRAGEGTAVRFTLPTEGL